MSGALRSAPFRGVLMMGAGLLLLSAFIAAPTFTHGSAADIPLGSPAFGTLWNGIEPVVPNFWGPAYQNVFPERYQEATNGSRLVQYFDKARMEQTTESGPVTSGLLTVELITGQRQMGDTSFIAFPPSILPVVGDPTNSWPPYSAFGEGVFAAKVSRSSESAGTVYKSDGTFGLNPGLAADPGAAFGSYQSDPGGRFAHNIPVAFSSYLAALPLPWLSTMGLPLTEAVWVNVNVRSVSTWVLVQPFERRVLSYTPTNPERFRVEMGNIGRHYFQWRYPSNSGGNNPMATSGTETSATTTQTTSVTTQIASVVMLSGTPGTLTISSVQLGTVTDTVFSLTFRTSIAATTDILYGTVSHSYTTHQDISSAATQTHQINLTGLQPGTKYYFVLRATAGSTATQAREDYFTTAGTLISTPTSTRTATAPSATMISTPLPATPTTVVQPPSPTSTMEPQSIHMTLTRVVVGAASPALLAPTIIQLDGTIVALSAYSGSSNATTGTVQPTNWVRDPTNATASSSTASGSLSLTDKHTTLVLTASVTIPFVDTTTTPLTVTYSRNVLPAEYASGATITSPPLSNTHSPDYSVTLTFSVTPG